MTTIKSVEEKARAYDEAIEKGKQIQNTPYTAHWDIMKEVAEHLLPELKESEDERIRRNIIATIHLYYGEPLEDEAEEMIAWLESQGEQNPADTEKGAKGNEREIPISVWSEEDENRVNRLIAYFEDKESFTAEDDIVYANWLKSLKERYTWKPSDEQVEALDDFIYAKYPNIEKYGAAVKSLYQDLKKLREK